MQWQLLQHKHPEGISTKNNWISESNTVFLPFLGTSVENSLREYWLYIICSSNTENTEDSSKYEQTSEMEKEYDIF